jgi:hypothetical protein
MKKSHQTDKLCEKNTAAQSKHFVVGTVEIYDQQLTPDNSKYMQSYFTMLLLTDIK